MMLQVTKRTELVMMMEYGDAGLKMGGTISGKKCRGKERWAPRGTRHEHRHPDARIVRGRINTAAKAVEVGARRAWQFHASLDCRPLPIEAGASASDLSPSPAGSGRVPMQPSLPQGWKVREGRRQRQRQRQRQKPLSPGLGVEEVGIGSDGNSDWTRRSDMTRVRGRWRRCSVKSSYSQ
jgi:hypothetical protein